MNRSPQNTIYAGFGLALLILAIIGSLSYLSIQNLRQTSKEADETYNLIAELNGVLYEVKNIESGNRSYVLTGREEYLTPRTNASQKILDDIKRLKTFKADGKLIQARMDTLEMLVKKRIEFADNVISTFRTEGFEKARKLISTDIGENLTGEINRIVSDLKTEELILYHEYIKKETLSSEQTVLIILVGGALAFIFVVLSLFVVKNDFKKLEIAENALKEYNENLEATVAKRTSGLRLGNEIISNLSEGVSLIKTSDGTIVYANPQFEKMFGYQTGEILGKHISVVNAPTDKSPEQTAIEIITALSETGIWSGEVLNIKKDGTTFWSQVNVTTFEHPEFGTVWICVTQDITSNREAREFLKRSNEELEKRVTERTEELSQKQYLLSEAQRITQLGIWDADLITGDLYWSDETYKIYGVSPDSFAPSVESLINLIHPDDRGKMKNWIESTLSGKKMLDLDFRAITPDGKLKYILGSGEAFFDSTGKPIRIIGTGQDITGRKLLEEALSESEMRFRGTFEQAAAGIAHVSLKGRFINLNKKFCDITGYSFDEMITKTFQEITHPDDLEIDLGYVNKMLSREIENYSMEKRYFKKDGSIVWVNLTVSLIYSPTNEPEYFIAVVEDITNKKQMELKLSNLLEELKRSNTELEQFAYIASHDLQEPLRMVSSYTQLLSDRYKDKLDENATDFINFAVDGAVRMQIMINDLLDYSRVQTRGNNFNRVHSSELLARAIINLKNKIQETNTIITNNDLPEIVCDGSQVIRLMQNLIDNAIKFKRDENVVLSIRAKENDNNWEFIFTDNGIGINKNYVEKVFEIFRRLHTHKYPGTGIGLAICKRIVERHGGNIWIESQENVGSSVHFTISKKEKNNGY